MLGWWCPIANDGLGSGPDYQTHAKNFDCPMAHNFLGSGRDCQTHAKNFDSSRRAGHGASQCHSKSTGAPAMLDCLAMTHYWLPNHGSGHGSALSSHAMTMLALQLEHEDCQLDAMTHSDFGLVALGRRHLWC